MLRLRTRFHWTAAYLIFAGGVAMAMIAIAIQTPPSGDEATIASGNDANQTACDRTTSFAPRGPWLLASSDAADTSIPGAASAPLPLAGPPLPQEYDATVVAKLTAGSSHGDIRQGIDVFRSTKFACMSCHRVGEHGGAVGPELSDVGKRLKVEEIVEAVLWPKKHVKPEYVAWLMVLGDGRTIQGYKRGETTDAVQFFDPAAQKTETIARADIEAEREAGTLMPDGLAAAMTEEQRRGVVRFLSELGRDVELAKRVTPIDFPAPFAYQRNPLVPANWQLWQQPVNRDRVYDFYLKEALYFRTQPHAPHLLPAFPGLDGGNLGHWGNQDDKVWADSRWNDLEQGPVLASSFFGDNKLVIPKGVCVRLGDDGAMSTCFNPQTLSYDAFWGGGFVTLSTTRHGFLGGLRPKGKKLPIEKTPPATAPFVYHGYYRTGKRIVFSYRLGDVEMLDSPWAKDGKFERIVAPAAEHPLKSVLAGSPAQWPEETTTVGELGQNDGAYVVDTIQPPYKNPFNSLMFFGDHDFLPDGSALIGSMTGDIWRVTGLDDSLKAVKWRRFAAGLYHPLGLVVSDGGVYVLGRDQITRLHDLNNDGEADFYECFSNKFKTSPSGHDFICGLARDPQGRFYTASGEEGLIRISADGQKVEVLATGFRNPDGLGLLPDGSVTIPCSEGDWTPSSMVCLLEAGRPTPVHFGHGGPRDKQPPALPLVYLARGIDNSSGGQVVVSDKRFGPLADQIMHFSFGMGSQFVILRDEVDGQSQGAVVPLPGEFRSGAHRGKRNPRDGQLYVSGCTGWGSYTPEDACFQRVRYTGQKIQLPESMHIHENGLKVRFLEPVDRAAVANLKKQFAQVWNYRYGPGYGSPEQAPSHPNIVGHEVVGIRSVQVLDERTVFVEIPELQPVNQLHLTLQVGSGTPNEMFVTVHKLDAAFTGIEGYQPRKSVIAAHPQTVDLAMLGKTIPNPWRRRLKERATSVLEIAAGKNLTFSTRTLRAKAGESIEVNFKNPDVVPHNWVLLKPGTLAAVGELTNKMVADPEAVLKQYVPKSDNVVAYTDIVSPQQAFSIYIKAPTAKGRYPYLCTFPGHWMVMNGELIVE